MAEPVQNTPESLDGVLAAVVETLEQGQALDRKDWTGRYPQFAAELDAFFTGWEHFEPWAAQLRSVARASAPTPPPGESTPARQPPDRLVSGDPDRFAGSLPDHELLAEVGRGGMGVVYKARQKSLNRLVALKMIRAAGLTPDADLRRFRNEARTVAHLDHQHIVPLYEFGEHDGQRYFTMKLIEGGSLVQHLQRFATDPRAAARLVAQVARAVHHAHQRGILHRDLKPSNILLDEEGRPHITDFGLAKHMAADSSLTLSGQLVGTPSYMAPEQAGGCKQAATSAADVYGLGAILYALLAGKPPFRGETVLDTLQQVKELEPERPRSVNPRVPRDLETICLKCLRKDPAARYGAAEHLAIDLEAFLAGDPIQARPPSRLAVLGRWYRQHKPLVTAIAACLIVVLILFRIPREQEHRRTSTDKGVAADLKEAGPGESNAYQTAFAGPADVAMVSADDLGWAPHEQERNAQRQAAFQKVLSLKAIGSPNYEELGDAYSALHRFVEAEAAFRNLIAQGGEDAHAYRKLGFALFGQGKLGAAIAAHEKAIAMKSDDAYAYNGLGVAQARQGNVIAAISAFQNASAIQPRWAAPYFNLGDVFMLRWNLPQAIAAYEKVIELEPDAGGAYVNLGIALDRQRKLPQAIAAYEKAIERNPKLFQTYLNLGHALYHQRKLPEAVAAYEKAIERNPRFAQAYKSIGLIQYEEGYLPEAIEYYRKANGTGSESGRAYRALGFALQEQGKFTEGLAALRNGYEDEVPVVFAARIAEAVQLVQLGDKVQRILTGVIQPKSPLERATLAHWCQRKSQKRYALAARFYGEAFATDPALARDPCNERRYSAARAAALAGCGQGKDAAQLEAGARKRLREQALAWLQDDLTAWRQLFDKGAAAPVTVSRYMVGWQGDSAFDDVRGAAVERLPQMERQHWQEFWRDVEQLLRNACTSHNPLASQ
jgi:tetratricopeptide (TPR) repeat protein/tRNA A-37 threonylcarbamoyl transferase component Bud32